MANTALLREAMKRSGMPTTTIAKRSGMLRETLYNRLEGKGEFKASEIVGLSDTLSLSNEERDRIFFALVRE